MLSAVKQVTKPLLNLGVLAVLLLGYLVCEVVVRIVQAKVLMAMYPCYDSVICVSLVIALEGYSKLSHEMLVRT